MFAGNENPQDPNYNEISNNVLKCEECGNEYDADDYKLGQCCPKCAEFYTPVGGICPACDEPVSPKDKVCECHKETATLRLYDKNCEDYV
jgi:hypothetical protein